MANEMKNKLEQFAAQVRNHAANDPSYLGHRLRDDVAVMVLDRLKDTGMTQKELAKAVRTRESVISKVVHGHSNLTLDFISRVLFALNLQAKLVQVPDRNSPVTVLDAKLQRIAIESSVEIQFEGRTYDEQTKTIIREDGTSNRSITADHHNRAGEGYGGTARLAARD